MFPIIAEFIPLLHSMFIILHIGIESSSPETITSKSY